MSQTKLIKFAEAFDASAWQAQDADANFIVSTAEGAEAFLRYYNLYDTVAFYNRKGQRLVLFLPPWKKAGKNQTPREKELEEAKATYHIHPLTAFQDAAQLVQQQSFPALMATRTLPPFLTPWPLDITYARRVIVLPGQTYTGNFESEGELVTLKNMSTQLLVVKLKKPLQPPVGWENNLPQKFIVT